MMLVLRGESRSGEATCQKECLVQRMRRVLAWGVRRTESSGVTGVSSDNAAALVPYEVLRTILYVAIGTLYLDPLLWQSALQELINYRRNEC